MYSTCLPDGGGFPDPGSLLAFFELNSKPEHSATGPTSNIQNPAIPFQLNDYITSNHI